MAKLVLAILVVSFGSILAAENRRLNDFITHYESVEYNHHELMADHERLKRTISGKRHLELQFNALGKHFHFHLYPDTSMFSDDFKMFVNGRPHRSADMTMYYSGQAVGDSNTRITGDLSHGAFVGTIITPEEQYHIEPASYHFPADHPHHSIIYRSTDVDYTALKGSTCGLSHDGTVENVMEAQGAKRQKRNVPLSTADRARFEPTANRNHTVCKLSMTGDFRFFDAVGNENINTAKAFLTRMVAGANIIFDRTNFYEGNSGGSDADMIRFVIAHLNVISSASDEPAEFQSDFIGVESYLQRHSNTDHSGFCLAYRFTYRDFANGVLGLAYVAQQGAIGGICSNRLNTGIVTLLNFGRRVPENVNVLTFSHEIGHNFGSFHDPPTSECQPGAGGNYIMFESASSGREFNNDRFSPCSIRCMEAIITSRAQQPTPTGCFIVDPKDCGNGIVDEGEECDCMFGTFNQMTGVCDDDPCCDGRNCTLIPGMACSPQQGPCCMDNCTIMSAGPMCSRETECANASHWMIPQCPTPDAKVGENSTALQCNNGTATCSNGTCSGSLCSLLGYEECLCDDPTLACDLCCNVTGVCRSSTELASEDPTIAEKLGDNRMLPVGQICIAGDVIGYCDFLSRCRPVDADGALNRLLNFLSSDEIQSVIQWVVNMWWVIVICIVGVLIILFVIVVVCHFTLPKPKHMKQQAEYRRTLRRNRQGGYAGKDYPMLAKT